MQQFVGIRLAVAGKRRIGMRRVQVDEVTARMPSSTEAEAWDLPSGIPLLFCRRLSYDRADTLIEISDAWYPADRTELRFVTPLKPWPSPPQKLKK